MTKNEAIKCICEVPVIYEKEGNVSPYELFTKAQKLVDGFQISKKDIIVFLKKNNKYIDIWEEYAQDKRTDEGYYLAYENGQYRFGFLSVAKEKNIVYGVSEEPFELCAGFILKECEHISKL